MVAKTKTKTRTRTITVRARTKARGFLERQNIQKLLIKAGLGVAGGLVANVIANRIRPEFADESGIIVASLAGGAPGTILWTLLGRRLTAALQGAFTPGGVAAPGTVVGL